MFCFGVLVVMMGTGHTNLYSFKMKIDEGGVTTVVRKIGEFVSNSTDWRHMHHFSDKSLQGLWKYTFVFAMHCILEKQLGVKFWTTVNQLFGLLDFV